MYFLYMYFIYIIYKIHVFYTCAFTYRTGIYREGLSLSASAQMWLRSQSLWSANALFKLQPNYLTSHLNSLSFYFLSKNLSISKYFKSSENGKLFESSA